MKHTKKQSELLNFIQVLTGMNEKEVRDTKFASILRKQLKVVETATQACNEEIEQSRIDNCSVDDRGNIIRDATQNYTFTKDALKKLTAEYKAIVAKTIEVEIFLKPEHLKDCPDNYLSYFKQFLGMYDKEDSEDVTTTTPESPSNTTPSSAVVPEPGSN